MKLYQAKNRKWIRVLSDPVVPPGAPDIKKGDEIFFYHLDGFFSFSKSRDGNIVHLAATAEVEYV